MTPPDPNEIPDEAGVAGTVGWIGEDIARGLFLRAALLIALTGALVGGLATEAPVWSRVAAGVSGLTGFLALLLSTLSNWPRSRQWTVIVTVLVITGALFAFHLSQR